MSKRRLPGLTTAIAVVTLVLILVCASLPFLLAKPIYVTQTVCDRIQLGMTQDQVEGIVGVPPGEYSRSRRAIVLDGNSHSMCKDRIEEWGGDEDVITVGFGSQNTVLWTKFVPFVTLHKQTLIEGAVHGLRYAAFR